MTLGTLLVKIGADTAGLRSGIAEAAASTTKLGSTMRGALQSGAEGAGKAAKALEQIASKAKESAQAVGHLGIALGAGIAAASAVVAAGNLDRGVKAQVDRSKLLFQTLATEVARAFEPMIKAANAGLRDVIAVLQHMDPALKQQIVSWVSMAVEVGAALLVFSKLATVLKGLAAVANLASAAVSLIFSPGLLVTLGAAALAVMGIVLAVGALKQAIQEIDWGPLTKARDFVFGKGGKGGGVGITGALSGGAALVGAGIDTMFPGLAVAKGMLGGGGATASGPKGPLSPVTDALAKSWDVGVKTLIGPLKEQFESLVGGFKKVFADVDSAKKKGITFAERQSEIEVSSPVGAEEARNAIEVSDSRASTYYAIEGMKKFGLEISSHVPAVGAAMTSYNKTIEEHAVKLSQAAEAFVKALPEQLMSAGGKAGGLANTFVKTTAETGDPRLGALAAGIQLITMSKQFQEIIGILDNVFQTLADTVGAVLQPLEPLFVVLDKFVHILSMVLTPLLKIADLVMPALFTVLKYVAVVVLAVVEGIGIAWNAILSTVENIVSALGMGDFAAHLKGMEVDTKAYETAMGDLLGMTYEQAAASAHAAAATNAMTEALTNVPTGFRTALARYRATDPQQGGGLGGTPAPGPGAGPEPGTGGGVTVGVTLDGRAIATHIQIRQDRTHGRNWASSDPMLSPQYAGT